MSRAQSRTGDHGDAPGVPSPPDTPSAAAAEQVMDERRTREETKRRVYLVVLTLSTLAALTTALRDGLQTPYWGVVYPVLGVYTLVLLQVMGSRLEELTAARAQASVAAHQAHTDVLTDLPNRRRLDDELDRHRALAQRHNQPLSVILIDLDHFKVVNDQLGHDVGDQVLIAVARRLSAAVRRGDLVGRWGGEEFLLIAPQTDHSAALRLAERCRARIADVPFEDAGHLTASFGIATMGLEDDMRALLRRADLALYTAKTSGRNRVATMLELAPPHDPQWARDSESQTTPE